MKIQSLFFLLITLLYASGCGQIWGTVENISPSVLSCSGLYTIKNVQSLSPGYVMAASKSVFLTQQSGNFLMVAVYWNQPTATVTVSDSLGNHWQQLNESNMTTGGCAQSVQAQIWYAENIIGGSNTILVHQSLGTNPLGVYVAEYSGVASIGSIDSQTTKITSLTTTSMDSNSLTTSSSCYDLIVGLFVDGQYVSGTMVKGAGWTQRGIDTNFFSLLEDNLNSPPGTYDLTATDQAPADKCWTAVAAAFKPK